MREWSILAKKFIGEGGVVKKLSCVKLEPAQPDGKGGFLIREIPGTEFELEADLILLAMGFVSAEHQGLPDAIGTRFDVRGNIKTDEQYQTSVPGIFSAGDMRRGQSLVAWAASEGRRAAHFLDRYLMGRSRLPLM